MSNDLDLDPEATVYFRTFTRSGHTRKLHLDVDCRYVEHVGDDYYKMPYREYEQKNFDLEVCKACDPEFEEDRSTATGNKSRLELAMENGDVPDDVLEVDL
jgi:hypothetical protein